MSQSSDLVKIKENMTTLLAKQIMQAISNIQWGSVEIFIQDSKIVQITERNIRKPHLEENKETSGINHSNGKVPS